MKAMTVFDRIFNCKRPPASFALILASSSIVITNVPFFPVRYLKASLTITRGGGSTGVASFFPPVFPPVFPPFFPPFFLPVSAATGVVVAFRAPHSTVLTSMEVLGGRDALPIASGPRPFNTFERTVGWIRGIAVADDDGAPEPAVLRLAPDSLPPPPPPSPPASSSSSPSPALSPSPASSSEEKACLPSPIVAGSISSSLSLSSSSSSTSLFPPSMSVIAASMASSATRFTNPASKASTSMASPANPVLTAAAVADEEEDELPPGNDVADAAAAAEVEVSPLALRTWRSIAEK